MDSEKSKARSRVSISLPHMVDATMTDEPSEEYMDIVYSIKLEFIHIS